MGIPLKIPSVGRTTPVENLGEFACGEFQVLALAHAILIAHLIWPKLHAPVQYPAVYYPGAHVTYAPLRDLFSNKPRLIVLLT